MAGSVALRISSSVTPALSDGVALRGAKAAAGNDGRAKPGLGVVQLKPTTRSGPDGWLRDGPILKPAQWTRHVKGANTGRTQVAVS
jgi:hypothetical protein